ncbi:MAG: cell division protein FtsA, partial [Lentisphaerota bacterium]
IDLGGGTTDYVVYARNTIAAAGVLAVGGDHVTNDISKGLRIPILEAERLKEEVGSAIADLTTRAQKVPLSTDAGTAHRAVKLSDLNSIIHLRVEETFGLLKQQFEEENLLHSMGGGLVLTGGGAYMKNVERLAEKIFGLPCRRGQPRNVSGLAVATDGPEYASVVGMVRYGFKTAGRDNTPSSIWETFKRILKK